MNQLVSSNKFRPDYSHLKVNLKSAPWTIAEEEMLHRDFIAGASIRQIAENLNEAYGNQRTEFSIYGKSQKMGLTRERHPRKRELDMAAAKAAKAAKWAMRAAAGPGPKIVMSLWHGEMKSQALRISMPEIVKIVADAYRVKVDDILGDSRQRKFVIPRHHAIWIMCQQAHLSTPRIGQFMGGRDHTTIMNGRDRHQARIDAGTVEVSL